MGLLLWIDFVALGTCFTTSVWCCSYPSYRDFTHITFSNSSNRDNRSTRSVFISSANGWLLSVLLLLKLMLLLSQEKALTKKTSTSTEKINKEKIRKSLMVGW